MDVGCEVLNEWRVLWETSGPPPFVQNQPGTLYDPPGKMDKKRSGAIADR